MAEVVFSESAGGSLKLAQSFGKGPYQDSGLIGFIFEERTPPPDELERLRQQEEERCRRAWEQAVPLGGRAADVFAFDLGLSMGDLSRRTPPRALEDLRRRFAAGEKLRVWYSDQPDERCGLYWLMAQLSPWEGTVSYVKLPDLEIQSDGILRRTGCGELAPEEWHTLLPLEQPMPQPLRRYCAQVWARLEEENAPLRAVVNGEVRSVPENLYDGCILREIAAAGHEFHEAAIIGRTLGNHELRICDEWLHRRIDALVRAGRLEEAAPAEEPGGYRGRVLRKTNKFTTQ